MAVSYSLITIKKFLFRCILIAELLVFSWYAVWGSHGIYAMRAMRQHNSGLQQNAAKIKQEIDELKAEIADWQTYPFYQEQYARENLQLSGAQDEVYFL